MSVDASHLATYSAMPLPLGFIAPVLKVTFLDKSLRATLAVLVMLIFYAPHFGTSKGTVVSILTSLVVTIGWFLAGDPYGIDNAYVALVIPLIVMSASHMLRSLTSIPPNRLVLPRSGNAILPE